MTDDITLMRALYYQHKLTLAVIAEKFEVSVRRVRACIGLPAAGRKSKFTHEQIEALVKRYENRKPDEDIWTVMDEFSKTTGMRPARSCARMWIHRARKAK